MKGFAFVLLCALVAVQGRHTGVQQSTRTAAALGENPWVVHLRLAVDTSGLLNSCVGSLIDNSWVLTTASCLSGARFIWVRYGVVDVVRPSLVTENSQIRIHPGYNATTGGNNVGLISIIRFVQSTANISPVILNSDSEIPASATFCGFGATESGGPGEWMNCYEVSVAEEDGSLTVSADDVETTTYDVGAPLVSDGVQVGILTAPGSDGSVGDFDAVADYLGWIEEETGLVFSPEVVPEAVKFVN